MPSVSSSDEGKYKMPNEGDKPGSCCEAMPLAIAREGDFPIAWRVEEMNCLNNQSFTGFGLVLLHYGYYPGEVYEEYAPVKFCPFCGSELIP